MCRMLATSSAKAPLRRHSPRVGFPAMRKRASPLCSRMRSVPTAVSVRRSHFGPRPTADIDRLKIPQRSSLLPYRGVLSFDRSTGDTGVKRREFITLLGGAVFAGPLAVRAQQAAVPVIGLLGIETPDLFAGRLRAFRRGAA